MTPAPALDLTTSLRGDLPQFHGTAAQDLSVISLISMTSCGFCGAQKCLYNTNTHKRLHNKSMPKHKKIISPLQLLLMCL